MALFRKHIDFVRLIAIVMAGTFLSACVTWQPQSLQPERFRTADSTQTVRLTLTSGETMMVDAPVITGDSLVGVQPRPGASPDSLERVSVPLATIRRLELQKYDVVEPVAFIGLLVVMVVAIEAALRCVPWCSTQ